MTTERTAPGQPLQVKNATRGTDLVRCGRVADNAWTRLVGLLGSAGLADGEGLLIAPCSSIHMFFMRFSIDAVYLNRDLEVVGLDADLKPWRIGRFYRGAHYVLELPVGAIVASATEVGDRVVIEGYRL
jgi:uncharacterized membrane protein (UPF0127 family)